MAAGEEIWLLLSRALPVLTLTIDSLLSFRGEWVGRVPLLSLLAAAAARTAATACAESMPPIVAGEAAAAAAAAVVALECC